MSLNVIFILWLRQLKRHLRSKSRIIGSIGQPLIFLLAFGFGFGPIFAKSGGGNYMQFLAPGIIAMGILFTALFTGIEVIWDKQFGFLKEMLVAPVSRLEIMIGRTLGGATVSILQGITILLIALLFGFRPQATMLPLALLFAVLIALLFTGLGTAIASTLDDMQGFQLIMNFVVMPIFFLSGALFPLNGLPKAISIIAALNPLTYGIDGLRGALVNGTQFGLLTDLAILGVITVIILAIGGYSFSKTEI